jgi:hypothetical protein
MLLKIFFWRNKVDLLALQFKAIEYNENENGAFVVSPSEKLKISQNVPNLSFTPQK